ncbi:MAG: serine kinase [Cyanobacteria bacterium P01_D01_bin.105]
MMNLEILNWMFRFLDVEAATWQLNRAQVTDQFEESDREVFFEAMRCGFEQAVQATNVQERFYKIGGYSICLRFAGEAMLKQIAPAIAHLEIPEIAQPDLKICLWDNQSTQTQLPGLMSVFIRLFHWYWHEHLDGRQNVKALCSNHESLEENRFSARLNIGANVFSMLDQQQNLAMYWIEDVADLPYWEKGSPLQSILNWWLSARARQYVHAAAVGLETGGVLIAAKGGSGKSTSALACLNSPLKYASDDYCLISTDPTPYVYSLYSSAKLKGATDFARFPELAALCSNSEQLKDEKALFFLHKHYPEKIVSGFPLRAILVPRITGEPNTHLKRITAIHALSALAPSTLLQLSGTGKQAFANMSQLVKQLPCYSLELGTDILQIPLVILELLQSLQSEAVSKAPLENTCKIYQ